MATRAGAAVTTVGSFAALYVLIMALASPSLARHANAIAEALRSMLTRLAGGRPPAPPEPPGPGAPFSIEETAAAGAAGGKTHDGS